MFEWHATLDLYSTSPWFSCLIQLQSTTTVGWALPLTMAICHAGPELIERLQNRSKMILTVLKFWGCCSTAFDGSLHAPTLSSVVIICLLMMMLSVGPALKPDAKGWTMLYYSTRPSLSSIVSCFWQRSTKEIGCLSQTQAKGCSEKPIGIVAFMGFWPWKSACSRGHDGHLGIDLHLALQCMDLKITCLRTSQTRSDIEVIL